MNDAALEWHGADLLRQLLTPLADLSWSPTDVSGDVDSVARGLRELGQRRPVLTASDGTTVTRRAHIAEAARHLGWTHVATRVDVAEDAIDSLDQMSLVNEIEHTNGQTDVSSMSALLRQKLGEVDDPDAIDEINEQSVAQREWVGLPEFDRTGLPFKLIISCATVEDREALLDALGISTIHKGTRGTLSTWWPEKAKEDLSSLKFIDTALGETFVDTAGPHTADASPSVAKTSWSKDDPSPEVETVRIVIGPEEIAAAIPTNPVLTPENMVGASRTLDDEIVPLILELGLEDGDEIPASLLDDDLLPDW